MIYSRLELDEKTIAFEQQERENQLIISTKKPLKTDKKPLKLLKNHFFQRILSLSGQNDDRLETFFSVLNGDFNPHLKERVVKKEIKSAGKALSSLLEAYKRKGYILHNKIGDKQDKRVFRQQEKRASRYNKPRHERKREMKNQISRANLLSKLIAKRNLIQEQIAHLKDKYNSSGIDDGLLQVYQTRKSRVDSSIDYLKSELRERSKYSKKFKIISDFADRFPNTFRLLLEKLSSVIIVKLDKERLRTLRRDKSQKSKEHKVISQEIRLINSDSYKDKIYSKKNHLQDHISKITKLIPVLREDYRKLLTQIENENTKQDTLHNLINDLKVKVAILRSSLRKMRDFHWKLLKNKDDLKVIQETEDHIFSLKNQLNSNIGQLNEYTKEINSSILSIQKLQYRIENVEDQITESRLSQNDYKSRLDQVTLELDTLNKETLKQKLRTLRADLTLLKIKIKQQRNDKNLNKMKIKRLSHDERVDLLTKEGILLKDYCNIDVFSKYRRKLLKFLVRQKKAMKRLLRQRQHDVYEESLVRSPDNIASFLDFFYYIFINTNLSFNITRDSKFENTSLDINKFHNITFSFDKRQAYKNFVSGLLKVNKGKNRVLFKKYKFTTPCNCKNKQSFTPSIKWNGKDNQILVCGKCGTNFNFKDCLNKTQVLFRFKIIFKNGSYFLKGIKKEVFEKLLKPLNLFYHENSTLDKKPVILREAHRKMEFEINFNGIIHLLFREYIKHSEDVVKSKIKRKREEKTIYPSAIGRGIAVLGIAAMFITLFIFYAIPPPLVVEKYDYIKIDYELFVSDKYQNYDPLNPTEQKILSINVTAYSDPNAGNNEGMILGVLIITQMGIAMMILQFPLTLMEGRLILITTLL
jgi:hypothetical protein